MSNGNNKFPCPTCGCEVYNETGPCGNSEHQQDPVVDKSLDRELIVTDERQRIMQTLLMNARPVLTDDGDRMFRGSEVQKAVNGEYEMNGPQRFGKASDTLKYTIDRLLKESKSKAIEDFIKELKKEIGTDGVEAKYIFFKIAEELKDKICKP